MAIDLTELEWAINDVTLPNANGPNKIEPVAGLKTSGVDWEQFLNAEELNWMFFKIYKAIEDLDSRTVVAGQLPIGSIYSNYSDNRNPGVILGYGTWVSMAGTVVVGAGTFTDVNGEARTFTAGTSDGEYRHTLTISEMPTHAHGESPLRFNDSDRGLGNFSNFSVDNATTIAVGGGQPHNNMQPYTVCYMWRRSA